MACSLNGAPLASSVCIAERHQGGEQKLPRLVALWPCPRPCRPPAARAVPAAAVPAAVVRAADAPLLKWQAKPLHSSLPVLQHCHARPLLAPTLTSIPLLTPAGTYAQERPPTHKTAGWLRFLFWEGGTQWDAWLCCASAQVRGARGGEVVQMVAAVAAAVKPMLRWPDLEKPEDSPARL